MGTTWLRILECLPAKDASMDAKNVKMVQPVLSAGLALSELPVLPVVKAARHVWLLMTALSASGDTLTPMQMEVAKRTMFSPAQSMMRATNALNACLATPLIQTCSIA